MAANVAKTAMNAIGIMESKYNMFGSCFIFLSFITIWNWAAKVRIILVLQDECVQILRKK